MLKAPRVSKLKIVMFMLAVLALAGLARSGMAGENQASTQVTIDNFSFAPSTLTIRAGTQVTWVNHDDIPHTVVSEDKSTFKSRALDTDEKFSVTFSNAGTYTYFCSIHPKMAAKVIVQ